MLKVLKQAKSAFSLLSADEIRKQAEIPLHFGLVVDSSGAYADMGVFLVLYTLPRPAWRRGMCQVHPPKHPHVPANVNIMLTEPGLPGPTGSNTFDQEQPGLIGTEILNAD